MRDTFIIVDGDPSRKAAISNALSSIGYVIPVDTVDDLAPLWPEQAWLLVTSDEQLAEQTLARLGALGRFYPLVIYGEALSVNRISALLHSGLVGTLSLPLSIDAALSCFARLRAVAGRLSRCFAEGQEALRRIALLSMREREVISLVSEGLSNKDISRALTISPRTVEIHRASAIGKLGVSNGFAAARLFYQANAALPLTGFSAHVPEPLPLAA